MKPTLRLLSLFLSITLALPNPVFALRPQLNPVGLKENLKPTAAGVEELGRAEVPPERRAVIFGAGNIGRGYLAPMLITRDDFDVIFVDFNRDLNHFVVDEVNRRGQYTVTPVGTGEPFRVSNIWAIPTDKTDQIAAQGPRADWIFTAVGTKENLKDSNIVKLAPTLRRYIQARIDVGHLETLNIIFAENLPVDQPEIEATRQAVLKDADADLARYVKERVNFIGAGGTWEDPEEAIDLGFREHSDDKVRYVGAVVQITVPKQRSVPQNPLDIQVEGGDYTLIVDAQEMKHTRFIPKGIEPVENIRAYREKKLLIHNLGHAVLAYLSAAKGLADPALGMEDPEIAGWVRRAMEESAAGLLHRYPQEFSPEKMGAYIKELLGRFANKELGDTVERVGQDPLRKLNPNDRLFGAASIVVAAGRKPEGITLGIAAAIRYARSLKIQEEKILPALNLARQLGLDLPKSDEAFWAAFHSISAGAEEAAAVRKIKDFIVGDLKQTVGKFGRKRIVFVFDGDGLFSEHVVEAGKTAFLHVHARTPLRNGFLIEPARRDGRIIGVKRILVESFRFHQAANVLLPYVDLNRLRGLGRTARNKILNSAKRFLMQNRKLFQEHMASGRWAPDSLFEAIKPKDWRGVYVQANRWSGDFAERFWDGDKTVVVRFRRVGSPAAGAEEMLAEMADAARGPVSEAAQRGKKIAFLIDSMASGFASGQELAAVGRALRKMSRYPFIEVKPLIPELAEGYRREGYDVIQMKLYSPAAQASAETIYLELPAGSERLVPKKMLPALITDAVALWQRSRGLPAPPLLILPAAPYLNAAGTTRPEFILRTLSDLFA